MSTKVTKLIGLCGRAGAGKSTVASILAGVSWVEMREYTNPWAYMLSTLFGWEYSDLEVQAWQTMSPDPVWNKTPLQAFTWLLKILHKLHPDIESNLISPFQAPVSGISMGSNSVRLLSFADALKRICIPISGLSYEVLLGETTEARSLRELPIAEGRGYLGNMSGRQLLEFVGTDCFRAVDEDFWIKVTNRTITKLQGQVDMICISDVRFENEAKMIRLNGGQLWVLARSETDLLLTEQDKITHPSKWKFLTFIDRKQDIVIINNKTISDLALRVKLPKIGRVTVVTGCMFSGKTSHLIAAIRELKRVGPVNVYKHSKDNRYSDTAIVSHNGDQETAIAVSSCADINSLLAGNDYPIVIDEGQFFDSTIVEAVKSWRSAGRSVIVAGLDFDSGRKAFGSMIALADLADCDVTYRARCECGELACYTIKTGGTANQIQVGGSELYKPACPNCFNLRI